MKVNGIQHIIWDWNGTLLDDIAASLRTINVMLARRGLPVINLVEYRDIFGFPIKDCYVKLGFDLRSESWDDVSNEFHKIYMKEVQDTNLRAGITRVLESLASSGKSMSVLSASELSILEGLLEAKGIRKYFKNVYGHSDLYGSSKVKLGRKFQQDTGAPSDHVLLIGDTDHDYEVACELNCRCILLTDGHQARERLQRCDCPIVENVDELFGVL